jgi:HSP20 family protein
MVFAAHRSFGPFGSLVARDPFREFARLDRSLTQACPVPGSFVPRIDAVEDDEAFRITAEVPGVDEADLSIEIEEGVLTLKGEKKSSLVVDDDDDEGKATEQKVAAPSRFHSVETTFGSFERRLRFKSAVDEEAVRATYRNGVLSIVVPKIVEPSPVVRTVPVQTA